MLTMQTGCQSPTLLLDCEVTDKELKPEFKSNIYNVLKQIKFIYLVCTGQHCKKTQNSVQLLMQLHTRYIQSYQDEKRQFSEEPSKKDKRSTQTALATGKMWLVPRRMSRLQGGRERPHRAGEIQKERNMEENGRKWYEQAEIRRKSSSVF